MRARWRGSRSISRGDNTLHTSRFDKPHRQVLADSVTVERAIERPQRRAEVFSEGQVRGIIGAGTSQAQGNLSDPIASNKGMIRDRQSASNGPDLREPLGRQRTSRDKPGQAIRHLIRQQRRCMKVFASRQPTRHERADHWRASVISDQRNDEVGIENDSHYPACRATASARPARTSATASTEG
jgi:hypothetical protein